MPAGGGASAETARVLLERGVHGQGRCPEPDGNGTAAHDPLRTVCASSRQAMSRQTSSRQALSRQALWITPWRSPGR
ncbi:hypothetical protein GCM10010269_70930 [Streptomyces humidus]|uniref:Uncharacterized protein n=1 Tax=Streptomyces humidus TaxID=52259 RepID=A0A918G7T6_9ACTN|nr:hypothetical protein GCM10010269_70930 [Streptomyces humidus]